MKYTCKNYKIAGEQKTTLIVALESKNNTIKTTHDKFVIIVIIVIASWFNIKPQAPAMLA